MTELTETYLNNLLNKHPGGAIHDTVLAIKGCLSSLGTERDAVRRAALMQEVYDLKRLCCTNPLRGFMS